MTMYQPNNIFAFEDGLNLNIFVALGSFSIEEFSDFTDKASRHCIPTKVNFIYPGFALEDLQLAEIRQDIKSRFKCEPTLYKYDRLGNFETKSEVDITAIIDKAKNEIICIREPIVFPPPGYSFIKPSGNRKRFFIRASNLFIRHAEMSFLALLLIQKWGKLLDDRIDTIYVDTIDLYGLVSLACRMRFGDTPTGPITVSFTSYTSYKEILKSANVSKSLMVISATTSYGLLESIIKKTRWRDVNRVVTILDLKEISLKREEFPEHPQVIARLTPKNGLEQLELLPSMRLAGENFSVDIDKPKSVILNASNHSRCLSKLKLNELFKIQEVISVYKKSHADRIPISIDSEKLIKNSHFKDWLKREIENFSPINTSHVIYIDSTQDNLKSLFCAFPENKLAYISQDELQDEDLTISGSVIVVCLCFTSGAKLQEISRGLRKHEKARNIVYLMGIGTPNSPSDFNRLISNLRRNPFQPRNFLNLFIGAHESVSLSWKLEKKFLQNNLSSELEDRIRIIENGALNNSNLYYRIDSLELNDGFRYWKDFNIDYSTGHPLPAIMLLVTFVYLLQNARIDESLPDEHSLKPIPNRQVLLDPENFFRFNDSLIQITILRAVLPQELDYSNHEDHSASIYYLVKRSEELQQNALMYELLLAIATRRLTITPEIFEKVRALVNDSSLVECKWFSSTEVFKNS